MSRLSPQHAQARRALIEDIHRDKKGWLQHGIAALAVSVLGLGVAGSIMLTGSAQQSTGTVETTTVQTTVQPGVIQPDEFESREKQVTRSTSREALSAAQVAELAKKRADSLTKADAASDKVAQKKATSAREKELASEAAASAKNAQRIKAEKDAAAAAAAKKSASTQSGTTTSKDSAPAASTPATTTPAGNGKASLPITSGYTIAAHFGQVGSWSRYHTGLDFAAPVGTPIHAPTSGTVTNAGSGSASGWAGNYVTIKHADGTSTLYAHMSTVSVSVGQTVTGGQVLGAVGMTGRTFGPHMHFEVYPAGVTPGDVYSAVNPQPWLVALGVNP